MKQLLPGAGPMRFLFAFDQLVEAPDGYGNLTTVFEEQFTMHAELMALRHGSEEIMAARLNRQQPFIARIRICANSERITPDWRARDARNQDVYNVRSITWATVRGYFDLLIQVGVAP